MKKKYHCANCNGLRKHDLLHEIKKSGDEGHGAYNWTEKHLIIECSGCENVSFLKIFGDDTMIRYSDDGDPYYYEEEQIYPHHLLHGQMLQNLHYLPATLKNIYKETIDALKVNALILTAGGFRAIIEATCNHLKIKRGNLEERIDSLHHKGYLSFAESKRLHSIRFLGNDALHEIETPKVEHLYLLLEIVNHLLASLYINDNILKGQLETVVDKYEDFLKLVKAKISKDMLKTVITVDELVGKSKRLMSKNNYAAFKQMLIKEIKDSKIAFLELSNEENAKLTVLKEPDLSWSWEI